MACPAGGHAAVSGAEREVGLAHVHAKQRFRKRAPRAGGSSCRPPRRTPNGGDGASSWAAVVIVLLAVGGIIAGVTASSSGSKHPSAASEKGPIGFEGIVLQQGTPLAPLTTAATGGTVGGVQCNSEEKTAYHIHTHLAVYVNGALRPITPGVGDRAAARLSSTRPTVPFYQRHQLLLLASRPRPGRRDPRRVTHQPHLHAGPVLRHLGSAADQDPGRAGDRHRHGVRQRQAIHRRPAAIISSVPVRTSRSTWAPRPVQDRRLVEVPALAPWPHAAARAMGSSTA